MKSVRITFRLAPYQLARGLQTIRQLEPTYKLLSLNEIVRTIYHDYLAKMSLNRNESVSPELIEEIISFVDKSSTAKILTLDDLLDMKPLEQDLELPKQNMSPVQELTEAEIKTKDDLTDEILAEINSLSNSTTQSQASKFNDPNNTESEISSVTDFSPPKDWTE